MKPLRPYLYHAYYDWIVDNEQTPYLLVNAEYPLVDVPLEYVREGKIILNVSPHSIGQYRVDGESIRFNARFNGMLRDVYIPFGAVEAVYAQQTGDGVMFQPEEFYLAEAFLKRQNETAEAISEKTKTKEPAKKRGHLKLVK